MKERSQNVIENLANKLDVKPVIIVMSTVNALIFFVDQKTGVSLIPFTVGLSVLTLATSRMIKKISKK